MPEQRLNRTREKRIADEIVVDCYTAGECAMGWYYYLEGKLSFPFTARCIATRLVSPLKKGEKVEVLGMAHEDDCLAEMFVLVAFADRIEARGALQGRSGCAFAGRRVGVPLAQLEVVKGNRATREAVEDWRYWLGRGYTLGTD